MSSKITALVLVAPGAEEMETIITVDVLRRAGIEVNIASIADDKVTKCSRDVVIVADSLLPEDFQNVQYDVLVLPGGKGAAEAFEASQQVGKLLQHFVNLNKLIAVICASPIALKAHNIYPGKAVTSHPSVKERLESSYTFKDQKVVVDGKLITSQGPGTAFDFALEIVNQLCGQAKVDAVKAPMCL